MAFKMNNAPFQKETREQRKAGNRAYRQSLKQERENERDAKPYVKGAKNTSQLLDKLENPDKTKKKHTLKKGVKNIAATAAAGLSIQAAAATLRDGKKGDRWIDRLGMGNPDNL